jgi:hypothetical protein
LISPRSIAVLRSVTSPNGAAVTWLCCISIAAQLPQSLNAQSAASSLAAIKSITIKGIALDSLHDVPWSGATIVVEDRDTQHADTIRADEDGHFAISATAGHSYELSATDSIAAVLGLQITASLRAQADSTARVLLTLPSATSLARLVCGPPTLDSGTVAGRVTSTDRETDLRDATVAVNWVATEVDVATHQVASISKVAIAHADHDGHFVVCGLPVPLGATLVVQMGSDSTTQPLTLTSAQRFDATALVLPSNRLRASAGTKGATKSADNSDFSSDFSARTGQTDQIAVTVLTTSGKPIAQAEVTLDYSSLSMTDSAGSVKFLPHPSRTHHLLVRKLGFAPLDVTSSVDRQGLTVHLHSVVPQLQTVSITAARDRARVEFEQRARTGIGDYFTESDIQRLKPECLLDLLKRLPGVQVEKRVGCHGGVSVSRGTATINGDQAGNGCVHLIVDGGPVSGYDAVNVDDILGVEFYDETTAPIRYGDQCALIAVWTKEARTIN